MTEVHFCNLCDQSVPDELLHRGTAVAHGGRVLCPVCAETVVRAADERLGRSLRRGKWVPLFVGLLAWGAAAFVWLEVRGLDEDLGGRVEAQARLQGVAVSDLRRDLDRLRGELSARLEAVAARVDGLAVAQAELGAAHGARLDAIESELADLAAVQDALARFGERLTVAETGQRVQAQEFADLRSALEILRDRIAELDAKVAAGPAPTTPEGDFDPEVRTLLEQLADPDPLNRNLALEKLGRYDDPRLAEAVLPLLDDDYEMNRFYAAEDLKRWKAREAVPGLIERLADDYSFVRKAANEALVAITGQDFGFEHKAPEADRRAAQERWQAWWQAASAEDAAEGGASESGG